MQGSLACDTVKGTDCCASNVGAMAVSIVGRPEASDTRDAGVIIGEISVQGSLACDTMEGTDRCASHFGAMAVSIIGRPGARGEYT